MALGSSFNAVMLAELKAIGGTVSIVCAGVTVDGVQDFEALDALAGEMPGVSGTHAPIMVPAGALPGLTEGAALTVAGVACHAQRVYPVGDGAWVRAELTK